MITGSRQEADMIRRKKILEQRGNTTGSVLYVPELPPEPTPGVEHRTILRWEQEIQPEPFLAHRWVYEKK